MKTEDINPRQTSVTGGLTDEQLQGVQGGIFILPPWERGLNYPKYGAPKSIAQGDTIDNNNNLPDAGGGVIV